MYFPFPFYSKTSGGVHSRRFTISVLVQTHHSSAIGLICSIFYYISIP